jgi:hypothetical protein
MPTETLLGQAIRYLSPGRGLNINVNLDSDSRLPMLLLQV